MPARRLLFALLLVLVAGSLPAKVNTLVTHDWFNPNGQCDVKTHALNRFMPLGRMVSDDMAVFEADSYALPAQQGNLGRYDVIVIWDMPRAMYKYFGAPEQGMRELISDKMAAEIVAFVKNGGGLILAGGTETCFTDITQFKNPNWGDFDYYGYKNCALEEILPVTMAGKGKIAAKAGDAPQELTEIFDRETVAKVFDGKAPLIATAQVGKGRVLAMVLNIRRQGKAWDKEGVVWDRAIRWAAGADQVSLKPEQEKTLVARYAKAINPPDAVPPAEWIEGEFPYVIWSNTHFSGSMLGAMYFRDLGFNNMGFYGGWTPREGIPCAKFAAANGFLFYPNLGVLHPWKAFELLNSQYKNEQEAWRSKFNNGDVIKVSPQVSAFAPLVRQVTRDIYQAAIKQYLAALNDQEKARFKGVFLDDEQTRGQYYDSEKGLLGPYEQAALDFYKKKTGQDTPKSEYKPRGYVAPAGDPWIKWVEEMRLDGWKDYCQETTNAIHELLPKGKVGYLCGAYTGGSDFFIDEYYSTMFKEDPTQCSLKADIAYARRDDLRGEKTMYWSEIFMTRSPGCGGGNKGSNIRPEQLRYQAGLALSRGLRGLVLWEPDYVWQMATPGKPPADGEVARIGQTLRQFGPMFLALKREVPPVWYLSSWMFCNSFDHYALLAKLGEPDVTDHFPWRRQQCDDLAWPSLLRLGVPVAAVTERQLMSPELMQRKAVVLPALEYCRQEVVDNLEKFIKQGGKVFVDCSGTVQIKGATKLSFGFDAWHKAIAEGKRLSGVLNDETIDDTATARRETYIRDLLPLVEKEIASAVPCEFTAQASTGNIKRGWERAIESFRDGVCSTMTNGKARYLFVLNNDLSFNRLFDVSCSGDPGNIYDVFESKAVTPVKGAAIVFQAQLPPGGWKVYLLSPEKFGGIEAKAALAGGALKLDIAARSAGAGTFSAAVPVRIEITAANRTATIYRSTDAGRASISLPLAGYLKDVQKVTVTELLTGSSQTVTLGTVAAK